jgi:hypothetical protein
MIAAVDREAIGRTDSWPALRRYILGRGGLGAGDWSVDLVPGRLYRRAGIAPDVLAAEMAHECAEAAGLWADDDGSDAMLAALQRAYGAHVSAQAARRVEASRNLPRGQRRLSDHVDRLAERWGDHLDLSAIGAAGEDVVRLYESGERVELRVGGETRKATVGCTGSARPEFVYLLSLAVVEVEDAA